MKTKTKPRKIYIDIDKALSGVEKAIEALDCIKTDDIILNDIISIKQELEHQQERLSDIMNIASNSEITHKEIEQC